MTSMFTWRDESGAPCAIVKNALDLVGSKNLINELKDKATKGTHIKSNVSVTNDDDDVRNSDVFWFNDLGLQHTLRGAVDIVNYECGWRYDIVDSEQLQFTKYDGAKKQHYHWHTDGQCDHNCARRSMQFHQPKENNLNYTPQNNLLGTVRKISLSAILNDDYEGGELMFRTLDDNSQLKEFKVEAGAGDIVVFPSFIDHKVAPVTKGIRYSVVAWYGGPPFK